MSWIDILQSVKEVIFLIFGFLFGFFGSRLTDYYEKKEKKKNIAKLLMEMIMVEAEPTVSVVNGIVINIKKKKFIRDSEFTKIIFFPTFHNYINENIALLESKIVNKFIRYKQGLIAAEKNRSLYIKKLRRGDIIEKKRTILLYLIGLCTYINRSKELLETIQKKYCKLFKKDKKEIASYDEEPNFEELLCIVNEDLPENKKLDLYFS